MDRLVHTLKRLYYIYDIVTYALSNVNHDLCFCVNKIETKILEIEN